MGFNQIVVEGRIKRDPRDLGGKGCGFVVVETFKKRDGGTGALYHECVAWGKVGEYVLENYHDNSGILLVGSLGYQTKDTNQDGYKIPRAQINVIRCVRPTQDKAAQTDSEPPDDSFSGDVPF